jgi:hypothetical protein
MRFIYATFAATALFLSCPSVTAQSSPPAKVGVPSLGFVYDSGLSAIRPILGFPGAAVVGAPLDVGFAVARAAAAARQRFVLAASADDNRIRLIQIQADGLAAPTIDGALISPDRIVLSPSARAAILYSQGSARLQVITGLPDEPVVAREMAVDDLGGAVDLAVSDDGELAFFVTDSSSVWLFDSNGGRMQISVSGAIAAVCFRPNGRDALAVARTGELYTIQDGGATASYGKIAGDQIEDPVGVQLSRDGSRAYVAYAQGLIAAFDSAAGVSKTVSCQCRPTGLDPVNSAMTFRVNGISDGPVMLFDGSGADPRVWFVPIDRLPAAAQGSAQ